METSPSPHVYLRDDGELGAEVVQSDLGDLHVVDGDLSLRRLQQPEEAQRHGRLAGSGATNDTNLGGKIQIDWWSRTFLTRSNPPHPRKAGPHLLSSSDAQRQLLEDEVQSLPVANAVVVELHVAMRGPFRRRLLVLHLPGGL